MKHVEFIYWLQGYFELSKDDQLTKDQINIVRAHIALSEKVTKKKSAFQNWLEGVFDSRGSENADLHPDAFSAVKKRLVQFFKHEIDPSYGGNQNQLNQLHGGSSSQTYRC